MSQANIDTTPDPPVSPKRIPVPVQQSRAKPKSESNDIFEMLQHVNAVLDESDMAHESQEEDAKAREEPREEEAIVHEQQLEEDAKAGWKELLEQMRRGPSPVPFPQPSYPQYQQPRPIPGYQGWPHQQPMNLQYHQAQLPQPTIHTDAILGVLQGVNMDRIEIDAVMDSGEAMLSQHGNLAQRIAVSKEYFDWSSSEKSRKLLIQGGAGDDSTDAELATALVSASLIKSLRSRDRSISLVFFCGRHVEPEDAPIGPSAMLSSFIAQLLQQHYADTAFRERDVDLESLRGGDVGALYGMFDWLVRQLPWEKTLVCVIDFVEAYETKEWATSMGTVLYCLMRLARDKNVAAVIKVLVTNPTGTMDFLEEFGDEDEDVLCMESLPGSGVESLQGSGDDVGIWELEDDADEKS